MKPIPCSIPTANLRIGPAALCAVLMLCLLMAPAAALAERNLNPGVVPPHANYAGLSYGEWETQWWITIFGTPVVDGDHPFLSGGAFGEEKGVVFLAAVPGGPIIDLNIPAGTALFFPIINAECSVFESDPFHGDDEASLRECANGHIDHTSAWFATIDGVPVANLESYRSESPLFEFVLPEDNLFAFFGEDAPAGTTSACVSAGVYLLLRPLAPGMHTVEVGGTFDLLDFSIDTTFHITVGPDEP